MKYSRLLFSVGILCLGLVACAGGQHSARAVVRSPTPEVDSAPGSASPPAGTRVPTLTLTRSPSPSPTPRPSISPTATPFICRQTAGRVERGQVSNALLDEPLRYRVYLPPCYDQQPQRSYPALYWLHGQGYDEEQWLRLGAAETADALIGAGEIPPVVIVMPGEQDHYTPPPENQYGDALITVLLPHIEEKYRLQTDPRYRAIGGLSRGGNWALHIGFSHYELFGLLGAHSAPTFVTDGESQIRAWVRAIPPEALPHIYLDTGADDRWRTYSLKLAEILADEDIPYEWHQFQGVHDESYWAAHLETYLRWYTQFW